MKACFGDEIAANDLKIIAMSDMHSVTNPVVTQLIRKKHINKNTVVILTGDMAGNGRSGAPGDENPYDSYVEILKHAHSLYFVQGNHDIYDPKALYELHNEDGTPCCVHNTVVQTPIGTIAGVNGIITPNADESRHKYTEKQYNSWISKFTKRKDIDIFLTHMPIRRENVFAKVHMYGHAHADKYYYTHNDSLCLNMDSRVIMFC